MMNIMRDCTKVRITELLRRYRERLDPSFTKIRDIQARLITKENYKTNLFKGAYGSI